MIKAKTIWITGASSGIGRATALLLAQHGYRLVLCGRRKERLLELEEMIQKNSPTDTLLLSFDIQNQREIEAAIEGIDEDWKIADVLLNNAGLAKGFSPINEGDLMHWETMIDTNVKGLLYITRLLSPWMVVQKSGHIINISSTAGKEVYPNGNVYCATKFAVEALTKSMRMDLYKHNIKVSSVSPGHVENTEFALVRYDGDTEKAKIYEDFSPLRALDIAETILFVLSRPAHVNIQDILITSTQQASATLINRNGRHD